MHGVQNRLIEWSYSSAKRYGDPFRDVCLHVQVTAPDGRHRRVPAFWAGEHTWRVRFSTSEVGTHAFRTVCSDSNNGDLHDQTGAIEVAPYEGTNHLYRHGPLRRSSSGTFLEHVDGTPFYWLADTWWMGLCRRLSWPEGFQTLVHDRVTKGFSVIQIVAGLYPDMAPFDDRGLNEAGFPWDREFRSLNPRYFDMADLRIGFLVEAGLVPCIVGCWGYYLDLFGKDAVREHWEYLVARYAAYPVVWCLAGEALMPFYLNEAARGPSGRQEYEQRMRSAWTDIARHVRSLDPFDRPITIHPTRFGHEMVDDPSLLDLDMLQTGHGSFYSLGPTIDMVKTAVQRTPRIPVVNSEVCYEGICGSSHSDVQRFLFWSCALNGTCGHTYGANGIWQVNSREEPYGVSPHGATWGNTPWEDAYRLPGSRQAGIMKRLLERYRWWEFEPHPEWIETPPDKDPNTGPFAAGIPGEVRVIFLPILGNFGWGEIAVAGLEQNVRYRAYHYDPITGEQHNRGFVDPDRDGRWRSPKVSIFQDWVLVLEKVTAE